MPRRRADPLRCANGHDLSDEANVYQAPSGKMECRRCAHNRVRRHRQIYGYRPPAGRTQEPEMTAAEVERYLAQGLRDEVAMAFDKPAHRRMWPERGSPPDRNR